MTSCIGDNDTILIEILSRMPSKSLVRFRSVCRAWNQLISSDPLLTNLHLRLSLHHNNVRIALVFYTSPVTAYCLDPENLTTHHHLLDLNGFNNRIGSCDGLVCTKLNPASISVWNPSTGTHTTLPYHVARVKPRSSLSSYGFFYYPACREYQLLRITTANGSDSSQVMLYSSEYTQGRSIGDVPYRVLSKNAGVVVHGALHWLLLPAASSVPVILAFDPLCHKFEEIRAPYGMEDHLDKAELAHLSGCLSIVFTFGDICHVWLMHKYHIQGSWDWPAFVFMVPTDYIVYPDRPPRIVPLYINNTGDMIFLQINNTKLVTYDRKKKYFETITINYPKTPLHLMANTNNEIFWAKPVVDSLVDVTYSHGGGQPFLKKKPETPYQHFLRTKSPEELEYLRVLYQRHSQNMKNNTSEVERQLSKLLKEYNMDLDAAYKKFFLQGIILAANQLAHHYNEPPFLFFGDANAENLTRKKIGSDSALSKQVQSENVLDRSSESAEGIVVAATQLHHPNVT